MKTFSFLFYFHSHNNNVWQKSSMNSIQLKFCVGMHCTVQPVVKLCSVGLCVPSMVGNPTHFLDDCTSFQTFFWWLWLQSLNMLFSIRITTQTKYKTLILKCLQSVSNCILDFRLFVLIFKSNLSLLLCWVSSTLFRGETDWFVSTFGAK